MYFNWGIWLLVGWALNFIWTNVEIDINNANKLKCSNTPGHKENSSTESYVDKSSAQRKDCFLNWIEDGKNLNNANKIGTCKCVDYFKDKKISDIITVKIVSSDNRGLVVQPEGAEMNILIKKSQIAVNASDQRATRFVSSDRIDVAVQELNLEKRKVSLSIKLLEEIQKKEALEKYGAEGSGKNLPFSTLSDKLKKKDKEKK